MLKSIKQQYIDLREGNMTQANFMRNLRMTMPQYVTNLSSFEDSVRILKNKGILTEADISSGPNAQWLGSIKDIIEDRWQNGEIKTPAEYGSVMTKLSTQPEGIIAQYGETSAEDAANKLLNSVSHLGSEYDPEPGEDEDFERDYDADYEEPNKPFDMAESLNEAKDEKGKWTNASGKELYAQFKEIDNLNGQEVLIGIDYEMEKNPESTKLEAAKIVIKNLKKNPIYYTMADLAGKEGAEAQYLGGKSAQPEARQMQPLEKNMGNVVDKKMGMKPVKDVEKVKKDSDKGGETNKTVKGISLMSLVAKSVRGVQKMDATGEKMKKITMKEGMGEYTFNGHLKAGELSKLKDMLPDAEIDTDEEPGQTIKTTVSSAKYNDKSVKHAVNQVMGLNTPIKDKKDLGGSFDKLKDQLKEMIRKQLKEMADGTSRLKEADNPVHFYITYTDPKKTEMMKAAATKAGMSIKVKVNNPQTDVELTLPGGRYFKMPDAEKMAKILDKLDVEWEDTIGLGFSMK
jgi:hypothetical protein